MQLCKSNTDTLNDLVELPSIPNRWTPNREVLSPKPETLNPKPKPPDPKPLHSKPETPRPQPGLAFKGYIADERLLLRDAQARGGYGVDSGFFAKVEG